MPTIVKGDRPMTAINVFTVAPEHQARLVELLRGATESSIRHVPGFVGAALQAPDGPCVRQADRDAASPRWW
jgi:hypothetical protein